MNNSSIKPPNNANSGINKPNANKSFGKMNKSIMFLLTLATIITGVISSKKTDDKKSKEKRKMIFNVFLVITLIYIVVNLVFRYELLDAPSWWYGGFGGGFNGGPNLNFGNVFD